MRPRTDFYTLCPKCETKVPLTLASKLQSSRAGCSCTCPACQNEWVCIQEWIYRNQLPLLAPSNAAILPTMQQPIVHAASAIPKPHIPVGTPAPATAGAMAGSVPQPHAWSWERQQSQRIASVAKWEYDDGGYTTSGN